MSTKIKQVERKERKKIVFGILKLGKATKHFCMGPKDSSNQRHNNSKKTHI